MQLVKRDGVSEPSSNMAAVLTKRGCWRQAHAQRESHVKVKAEMGVRPLQAKSRQRWPANPQELRERHGTDSPSQVFEGIQQVDSLITDF